MASKTIYKKKPLEEALTRNMTPLSVAQKTQVDNILSKFIQYLKAAHS